MAGNQQIMGTTEYNQIHTNLLNIWPQMWHIFWYLTEIQIDPLLLFWDIFNGVFMHVVLYVYTSVSVPDKYSLVQYQDGGYKSLTFEDIIFIVGK